MTGYPETELACENHTFPRTQFLTLGRNYLNVRLKVPLHRYKGHFYSVPA
jgi:hypothetical protein